MEIATHGQKAMSIGPASLFYIFFWQWNLDTVRYRIRASLKPQTATSALAFQ